MSLTKEKKYVLLLATIFVVGCNNLYTTPEITYLIKTGDHHSNVEGSLPRNGQRVLKTKALEFTARFNKSAAYDLKSNDQQDINKLFGFSDCNSLHQKNSARFGWNYNTRSGEIDIFSYVYKNGKRITEHLGSTTLNETVVYKITVSENHFIFDFKGTSLQIERGSQCNIGLYYMLFPYFGGNQTAPHDIRIFIRETFSE